MRRGTLHFDRRRIGCIGVVFIGLAALNVTPILQAAGAPLALCAALFSVFDPFAAYLFIAGSQIAPDAPALPFTLAQLFVLCWAATLPLNGCLRHLGGIAIGMRYAAVFIGWWLIIGAINRTIDESTLYGWVTCAIACTYVPQTNGTYRGLLWMLALGAGLALIGPWGAALGLPVEGQVYEQAIRGGLRIGAGRGDVNVAAQNLGFFLWTTVALMLPASLLGDAGARMGWTLAILATLAAAGSAILSTGSRGGLGYLMLGGMAMAALTLLARRLRGAALGRAFAFGATLLIVLPVIWPWFIETSPGRMLLATLDYNAQQALNGTGDLAIAGRADIWLKFLDIARDYPLAGAPAGATLDMGEYGFVTLGESNYRTDASHAGTGHNVWIDIAAGRGFPAAAMFAVLFFAPILHLAQRRGLAFAQPFIMAHLVVFLVFFNLSVANWKTYWALHALTAFASARRRRPRQLPSHFADLKDQIGRG